MSPERGISTAQLRRNLLRLDGDFVFAGLLIAIVDQALAFRRFFQQIRGAALWTLFGNGFVPDDEIAIGIFDAAVEEFSALGAALDELAAAAGSGAGNADRLRFNVFALWIIAASDELSETAVL